MAAAEPFLPVGAVRQRWASVGELRHHLRAVDQAALVLFGLLTIAALVAPYLAPHNPLTGVGQTLAPPGHGTLMGTDEAGRDIFSRVLFGLRATWLAAVAVIASGVLIGGAVGLAAGASGGILDAVLMRLTDAFLALPAPVLAIAVVAALGPSFAHVLLALAIVWWPYYARIVHADTVALAARPHVDAARLAGAGARRLWLRHLLPGTIPSVVVAASLDVGNLILTLAALSFLGLGAPQPAPELGSMTAAGLPYLLSQWWISVFPAAAVFILAFLANLAGDALRDLMTNR